LELVFSRCVLIAHVCTHAVIDVLCQVQSLSIFGGGRAERCFWYAGVPCACASVGYRPVDTRMSLFLVFGTWLFKARVDVGPVATQPLARTGHHSAIFAFGSVAGVATVAFGIRLALPHSFSWTYSFAGYASVKQGFHLFCEHESRLILCFPSDGARRMK
jgi:hypothetical protein